MDPDFEDFDFDNDKIRVYLKNKLEEIKSNNDKLQQTIKERQQCVEKLTEGSSRRDNVFMKVDIAWKKIFNDKYSLGFYIENETNMSLSSLKVYMKWNSNHPLAYKVSIFGKKLYESNPTSFICDSKECQRITEYLTKSLRIESYSYLVVTIDMPKFTEKLEYEIDGNIVTEEGEKMKLKMPNVTISSTDATNRKIIDSSPLTSDPGILLAIISSSEVTELVMIFPPDWSSSLENTFEIYCSLTKIELSAPCRKYFIANRVSPVFDDSILEIHAPTNENPTEMYLTLYTRDAGDSLFTLCHHLFATIRGVILMPKKLHISRSFENEKLTVSDNSEDIISSMDEFL